MSPYTGTVGRQVLAFVNQAWSNFLRFAQLPVVPRRFQELLREIGADPFEYTVNGKTPVFSRPIYGSDPTNGALLSPTWILGTLYDGT
jgi:hypothetical protein